MSYKIGSFNCLCFGMATTKDIKVFIDIICKENFDIIALQEIKGQNALSRILSGLPNYWIGEADSKVNDYAFIWNTRRVGLAKTQTAAGVKISSPRIYQQYRIDRNSGQKDLIRDPYFARFIPVSGPFIEIRIINTHIRFSKGKSDDSSDEQTSSAIAMRKNEFDILTKAIYAKEGDKIYGNNRPAYTILLGDYNLNKRGSGTNSPFLEEIIEISDGRNIKKIVTRQNELTTLKKPPNDCTGEEYNGFSNNYDHFTYDSIRFDSLPIECYKIDSVNEYYNGDFEKHRKNVSDHVPIVMNVDFKT